MLTDKPRLPFWDLLTIGILPCFLKKLIYRFKGYKIGKNTTIGWCSIIIAKEVSIGKNVNIGNFTIIRANELKIESYTRVGSLSYLDTPSIHLKEDSKINEQVFIGGLQYPNSKFVLGQRSQIAQLSYINPTVSIAIGDDSAVGGHCLLFGHTSWQNVFEGYHTSQGAIEIGNGASLSWRVFVLPGVKIGDRSIVGANSLVNNSIPSGSLAVGSPARVVSKEPYICREIDKAGKRSLFREIIDEMLLYLKGSGYRVHKENNYIDVSLIGQSFLRKFNRYRFAVVESIEGSSVDMEISNLDLVVSLEPMPETFRLRLNEEGVNWLVIESKSRSEKPDDLTDEVAMWFRRYGVKFEREK